MMLQLRFVIIALLCMALNCNPCYGDSPDENNRANETTLQYNIYNSINIEVTYENHQYNVIISYFRWKDNYHISVTESEILDWAFNELPEEWQNLEDIVVTERYEIFCFWLLLTIDNKLVVDYNYKTEIIGNENLTQRIQELKEYLLRLWADSLKTMG